MTDYIPTTDEMQDVFVFLNKQYAEQYPGVDLIVVESEVRAQFGRWLETVKAEVRAEVKQAIEEIPFWHDPETGTHDFDVRYPRIAVMEVLSTEK